jgi:hypothetical protein
VAVRLTRSARKHGIAPDEIRRVLAAPLRTVAQESEHGPVALHIGLTARRDLLEVVVAVDRAAVDRAAVDGAAGDSGAPDEGVPDQVVVLHAMRLRPANYHHLAASPAEPGGPG